MHLTVDALIERDAFDPLAAWKQEFLLPRGVIYLDGNSLGALPRASIARLAEVLTVEWGEGLIRSWNDAAWIDLPARVGDKIARLIGAGPGSVVVADSTSVNLYKLISAALRLRPGRPVILSECGNFPSDLYVAEGLIELLGQGHRLATVDADHLTTALDDDVALLLLTHVDYRSGRRHDMAALTQAAHAAGSLVLWDLAHSAGAMPLDLAGCAVDLAVGCGYKYLNGGPGAPSFLYVAPHLQDAVRFPLTGWFGHARPFAFDAAFEAAAGVSGAVVGTPPVLSLAALEVGVEVALQVDLDAIRHKSLALADVFAALIDQRCAGHGLRRITPLHADARGSQLSYSHPGAYPIMQALVARGVIGDFRAPDILRFGFTPLYLGYRELWDAVDALADVLDSGIWRDARFGLPRKVT